MPQRVEKNNRSKERVRGWITLHMFDHLTMRFKLSKNTCWMLKNLPKSGGNSLRISKVCGLAALLHDLGKYSDAFQDYIRRATAGEKVTRGEVDHATAGGRLLFDMLKGTSVTKQLLAEIVSNAIISHHGNLHDYVSGEESPFLTKSGENFPSSKHLGAKPGVGEG